MSDIEGGNVIPLRPRTKQPATQQVRSRVPYSDDPYDFGDSFLTPEPHRYAEASDADLLKDYAPLLADRDFTAAQVINAIAMRLGRNLDQLKLGRPDPYTDEVTPEQMVNDSEAVLELSHQSPVVFGLVITQMIENADRGAGPDGDHTDKPQNLYTE